jgi:hypothetical protein
MRTLRGRVRGLRQQRPEAPRPGRVAGVAMSAAGKPKDHFVSVLASGVREAPDTVRRQPAADTSTATDTSHRPSGRCPAHVAGRSGRGGRSIRRPVNPLTGPTRYNFLYSSSRPALRAASGRPPARQRHDGHRGAGLTLPPGHRRDAPASTYGLRPVPNSPARTPDGSRSRPRRRTRPGRSGTTPRTETARPIPRPPPSTAPGGSSSPRSVASTRRTARR